MVSVKETRARIVLLFELVPFQHTSPPMPHSPTGRGATTTDSIPLVTGASITAASAMMLAR
jgi:hypothetical protein